MIVEGIVNAIAWVVSGIGAIMPDLTLPPAVDTAITMFGSWASKYWELGHVLPVVEIVFALYIVMFGTMVALAFKITRIALSFFTAGGGSAG